ncbi:hypothetical protein LL06_19125 [Hoeflea sp. BAL378]|uniref:hypothetical protein n=1 Tax=Hoeflea sp. BAL378 TaxID=1547437 RepID=UPI0005133A72|nr:hypothetical protein [Hoeflea sp. BAL378]KGF67984.1 hypothetical protein LL06_19125 [Hoeflea sp. BAL378]
MEVNIKKFDVLMSVKNKGVELEVYNPNGDFRGDLVITKTKLIWCEGKTKRENGVEVTWNDFIDWMNAE